VLGTWSVSVGFVAKGHSFLHLEANYKDRRPAGTTNGGAINRPG
jgi:hypothetical protein